MTTISNKPMEPVTPTDEEVGLAREAGQRLAALACTAAKRQRESPKKPPRSVEEYLALTRVGLPQTAEKLRAFSGML